MLESSMHDLVIDGDWHHKSVIHFSCAKICSHGSGTRPLRSIKLQLWGVTWRDDAFGKNLSEDANSTSMEMPKTLLEVLRGPGVELGVDAHLQGASTAPQNLRGNHLKHGTQRWKHVRCSFRISQMTQNINTKHIKDVISAVHHSKSQSSKG